MFAIKSILFLALLMHKASGHGRMEDPAARNCAWRYGFKTPANYNDVELNCGGTFHQAQLGGKCGVCGDPYDGVKNHETGGMYATGVITKTYTVGQIINVNIYLSANHLGYFEFRLCPSQAVTQACLDQYVLQITSSGSTQYKVQAGISNYNLNVKLPDGISCSQCVLQWRYHGGNNWGSENGQSGLGIGPQEEFINCADISITGNGWIQPIQTTKVVFTTSTTTTTTPIDTTKIIATTTPAPLVTSTTTKSIFYFCDTYRGPPLSFPYRVDPFAYHGLILCRLIDPMSVVTCKTCYEMCSTPLKECPQNCYCRWYPTQ